MASGKPRHPHPRRAARDSRGNRASESFRDAISGIVDQAKQVEKWKAAAVMLKNAGDPLRNLDAEEIATLAAEWTPDELEQKGAALAVPASRLRRHARFPARGLPR